MPDSLLIRLRPTGPWRIGPDSGARDRVDRIFHSDALYAAVCSAMARLGEDPGGELEAWLDATARVADPAVRLGSLLPYQRKTLYVAPPKHVWPPRTSARLRAKGARFVPAAVVADLLEGKKLDENRWKVDAESECLIPAGAGDEAAGPFRAALRTAAAVDRGGVAVAPHTTACLEFSKGSGLWCAVAFASEEARAAWKPKVIAAFRLLADSGFGGERSRGWGRAMSPELREGELAQLLFPNREIAGADETRGYWLLSLYHPADTDTVHWDAGHYALTTRGGRVESGAAMDAGKWGAEKQSTRMVSEGSVLVADSVPVGAAPDTAPEGVPHPVYRSGFAVSLEVPLVIKVIPEPEPTVQEPEAPAAEVKEPNAKREAVVETRIESELPVQDLAPNSEPQPEQQSFDLRPSPQEEIALREAVEAASEAAQEESDANTIAGPDEEREA